MTEPIPASIKGELDQTPEWWDGEFLALERKQIPRTYEYHKYHDLDEVNVMTYASQYVLNYYYCNDCGVSVNARA